jgi:methionyl-tRNA formyltransferase
MAKDIKNISILVDNPSSWFIPYAKKLSDCLSEHGIKARLFYTASDVPSSDICFLLSCTKIVNKEFLDKNKHNIVIHASDLPKGKGFTPLKWQILEGINKIPLTLFEAVEACDAGPYYIKDYIQFEGYEMLPELQAKMAGKIIEMALRFVVEYDKMKAIPQEGETTTYPRFKKEDDCLDTSKSIDELFNHFRIADNDRFPLFFYKYGHNYAILVKRLD